MTIQIAPSILSADFCNLERDLKAISNADLVHVDVMDHHFVPNLTLGEPIVARICQVTDLPVDVHLMIEDPDRWAPEYAKLGAASVSFHMGATHAPVRLARQLRDMGCAAYTNGVSEELFKIGMCLPSGPLVTDEDVAYIVKSIKEAIV